MPKPLVNQDVLAVVEELFLREPLGVYMGSVTIGDVVRYVKARMPVTKPITIHRCIEFAGPTGENDDDWLAHVLRFGKMRYNTW